jgi:glycosyltransferase involved in cell wall biosynthesis
VGVYFAPFMVGGAEWYMLNVSKELARRGNEVHVFTAEKYKGTTLPRQETIDGVTVHRIPLRFDLSYRLKLWDGLGDSIKSFDFDVVHAYDYAQPHTAIAMRAGKDMGSKNIITVFDVHSMIPRPWYKQLPMRRIERYFAERSFPLSDKVLVRAPELILPLEGLGVSRDKIIVTPSGILESALEPADGQIFLKEHGIEGSPVILYFGRMNPLKGPQHLIEAAPRVLQTFPKATFLLIGPDQGGYAAKLNRKVKQLGIENNVRIMEPIYEHVSKMQAFASCDIFVLPTSYEGTSQSIFEAMAQGKPVVSTRTGGIPFQVDDGVDGILLPLPVSVSQLGDTLVELLSDKHKAHTISVNAKQKAAKFTYNSLVDKLLGIYEGKYTT